MQYRMMQLQGLFGIPQSKDSVVSCCESQHTTECIDAAGGNAKLTVLPEVEHNDCIYMKNRIQFIFCAFSS